MADKADATSWEAYASRSLTVQREEFLETFFKRGAEFTNELLGEVHELQGQLRQLRDENAALRLHLASDDAIRDLLVKIEALENEKHALATHIESSKQESSDYLSRYHDVELELDAMANLYVASYQLHIALTPAEVFSIMEQILMQFVGVARFAVLLRRNVSGGEPVLETVHLFHCDELAGRAMKGADEIIRESVSTAVHYLGDPTEPREEGVPLACVPLVFGQTVIGVIAVYDFLEQKTRFVNMDIELFRLLGSHAAAAIAGAGLLAKVGDVFVGLDQYRRV
jgi:GAF domain-containing protein